MLGYFILRVCLSKLPSWLSFCLSIIATELYGDYSKDSARVGACRICQVGWHASVSFIMTQFPCLENFRRKYCTWWLSVHAILNITFLFNTRVVGVGSIAGWGYPDG